MNQEQDLQSSTAAKRLFPGANCQLHGVEPYAYRKDLLERLPRTTNWHVAELTPRRWKNAQRAPVKMAA
jgi:hypothetical protein